MRKIVEQDGWYGDNTLEGDYVSLHRGSHLIVNGERLELPQGQSNLLQLVCKRYRGQLLIAGQGQSYNNWLWKDNKWIDLGPSFATFSCAFGTSSLYLVTGPNLYCLYDLEADTLSKSIGRQIGSNGIHYIDFNQSFDGIVTGDSTYGPTPYNLSQWLHKDNLTFGQSYVDGAVVIKDKTQYKIEDGDTQFLRLSYDGYQIAVSIVKMEEKQTVFYWFDINELNHFPILNLQKEKGPISNSSPLKVAESSSLKSQVPPITKLLTELFTSKDESMNNLPSLDKWMHEEFPQLLAAYIKTQGHAPTPDFEWAAFQTYRRYMEPDAWPFEKMLRHELGQDNVEISPNPQ